MPSDATLKAKIQVEDDASQPLKKVSDGFDNMGKAANDAGQKVSGTESKLEALVRSMGSVEAAAKATEKGLSSMISSKGLNTSVVDSKLKSVETRLKGIAGIGAQLKITPQLNDSQIKEAQAEVKELQAQLKAMTGIEYNVDVNLGNGTTLSSAASGSSGASAAGAAAGAATGGSLLGGAVKGGLIGAAVTGIGGVLKTMFQGGSERQQYRTTMTHFLGGDKSVANQMMNWASNNATATQFDSNEVMAATSRAITVAQGDTDYAKELVQLAEDMTSLTPNTSLEQAMEALADASVGEWDRMNSFGFKGSMDSFKAAGGDMLAMKSDNTGKTLQETFAGGTAAGAENTMTKIGTIVGGLQDALASVGEAILNGVNPALDVLIGVADTAGPALQDVLSTVSSVVGETLTNLWNALQPYLPLLSSLAQLVGSVVSFAFSSLGDIVNTLVIPAVKWVGEKLTPIFELLKDQVDWATQSFKEFKETMKDNIKQLANFASWVKDKIGEGLSGIGGWIKSALSGLFGSKDKNATGTVAFRGGLTQMNENTRGEVVALPSGSRIYPYSTTERIIKNLVGKTTTGKTNNYAFNVNIDARGSNMTKQEVKRLKNEIVNDIVEAFDNMVPA